MKKTRLSCLLLMSLFAVTANVSCTPQEEIPETELPSTGDGDGDGDGGGGGGGTPAMTTQGNFRIIFVSSAEVNGTGVSTGTGTGLASFDSLCTTEATAKGFGGQFKAMLGTAQRKPGTTDWVLREGKEYRREDLTTVIDIAEDDVTAGGVIFPFETTPLTNTINTTAKYPWTGLKNDWTLADTNCSDWSTNSGDNTQATKGTYGKSSIVSELVDLGYTSWWGGPLLFDDDYLKQTCDQKHPVYCVQTKQLPPPGDYKILFKSTTTIRGDQGIPAMDAVCAADAVTKGLTGTYKAMVVGISRPDANPASTVLRRVCDAGDCAGATGTEQSVDWVLQPNTHYRRDDKVTYIGKTNEHAFLEGELEEPIASAGQYWSGMTNSKALSAAFQHCGSWSEGTFNGLVNEAGGYTADYGSQSVLCSTTLPVLCAEQ
ncbi:DUF1554 domain-containing protein [Bdellovibrio bacteriovorus]|uniref:DUF1554 domain-containing protein n=1 Tax=Bdellovibrio bacteriovorus TaxID=959 RepID=UPI003D094534